MDQTVAATAASIGIVADSRLTATSPTLAVPSLRRARWTNGRFRVCRLASAM